MQRSGIRGGAFTFPGSPDCTSLHPGYACYERLWTSGAAGNDVTLHLVRDKVVKHLIVQTTDRLAYLRS